MQRGKKAQDTFLAHILAGVEAAKQDPSALLVFSGGETRAEVGARTEGGTNRTTTEVFALDSYQNLLFSLLRFHELTDSYPQKITLVSYAFKRERFVELHRHAIRFPRTRFEFVGIDPTWDKEEENVRNGELENAVKLWREDLYACNVEGGLRSKRRGRNAGRRKWTYGLSVETSVKELLRWCEKGGGEVFAGRLPWSE
ncbi:hypothetical protein FN846DRAFT_899374 [Sphaerosporella brunnea]|uniref:DUF218 domain-containing protein n=1 Tax=Sphaerosporella brunnea TaxID=1250544 RepID=A0A5J5EUX0_9PEZI|nr:hypothetical protein FN846DRAFT_899374 [Sphaerosporella brunnea]